MEDGEELRERGRSRSHHRTSTSKRESGAKSSAGNVLVSVRVRPDASNDDTAQEGEWMVDGRRSLISYRGREGGDYLYDNVFSPHDQNARVYDNAAKRLVRRVMEGYHGTVFAYGMTGTGKTFSMQGTANSPGVIPLAITDIFSYIRENPSREFLLRVSYLEIYNEKIYDLLNASTPGMQQEEIKLREDSKRGVYATPLKEEIVQSPNQLLRVIARGDLARRTGSTQYNTRSSRSHAVVQIVVESRARTVEVEEKSGRKSNVMPGGVLVSTLSLIDLAGSERAADNKERRTEGAHINKSLLTLGTVIGRLSNEDEREAKDGAKTADKEKVVKHLPYRDSKLTRLLQPALSGNSLVSILCTIQLSAAGSSAAQSSSHTGETLNTLKFASRAKNNIVSHAKKNESNATPGDPGSRALLDRYRIEIQELRTQLEQQNRMKEETEKPDDLEEQDRRMEEELERQERQRHEEQMLEMQLARTALKERISHLNRLILSSKSLGVNSGRFSTTSLPFDPRSSLYSSNTNNVEYGRPVSIRSRDSNQQLNSYHSQRESTATLDVPSPNEVSTRVSSGSITMGTIPAAQRSQMVSDEVDDTLLDAAAEEEEDSTNFSAGDNGDGTASLTQQNRMLQADLADKNRYIATLEKRLLQARRTSHSRVSMHFAGRASLPEEGSNLESLLKDKDRELDELRQKLDDQVRMVTALRSAARKREMRDLRRSDATTPIATATITSGEDTARPKSRASMSNENVVDTTSDSVPDLTSLPFTSNRQDKHMSSSSRASRYSSARTTPPTATTATMGGHRSTPSTATNASRTSSLGGGPVVNFSKTPLSPVAILSAPSSPGSGTESPARRSSSKPHTNGLGIMDVLNGNGSPPPLTTTTNGNGNNPALDEAAKRRKSVDEMTALLDQMIQDKVESGLVVRGKRGSLTVKERGLSVYAPPPPAPPQHGQQMNGGAERSPLGGLASPIREMKEEELRELLREDLKRRWE
jgi:centromeric protein E